MRLLVPILLVIALAGCKSGSGAARAKALMVEANDFLQQQSKFTTQWADQYGKVFSPQNRAQFPANRNWFRTQADALSKLLDESSKLSNAAADKYEQAGKLMGKDQEQRGMTLFATAMRTDVEANELLKSQMRLVHDEQITDQETFNKKFMDAMRVIQQKEKEGEDQMNEGKRLLGM
jgi:DNA-binding transcriptional regulator YbjK